MARSQDVHLKAVLDSSSPFCFLLGCLCLAENVSIGRVILEYDFGDFVLEISLRFATPVYR